MNNAVEARIKELINDVARLENFTTGTLAMELCKRLQPNTQIRVTAKGVRVTHSKYIEKLKSAVEVDDALLQNVEYRY